MACLSGDNGHGKTALLDAMSWALWGAARARTQEELVHQGQQNMEVELEFTARRQRYLVNRKHTRSARSRQGATSLELQVASADGFRPITGGVMRETQRKIDDILNMDYGTFISTAFLRQGDADRFTKSRPAQRKATLAEVLDLSYYERMEEAARDRSRDIRQKTAALEQAIADAEGRAAHRPQYEAELAEVSAALGEISTEAQALWSEITEIRRTVDALRSRQGNLGTLRSRIAGGEREIPLLKSQVRAHESRVADFQEALEREGDIRVGHAALEEARESRVSLDQALAQSRELERGRADAEREIAVERARLSVQASALRANVDTLRSQAARLPRIEAEVAQLAGERSDLDGLDESVRRGRRGARRAARPIPRPGGPERAAAGGDGGDAPEVRHAGPGGARLPPVQDAPGARRTGAPAHRVRGPGPRGQAPAHRERPGERLPRAQDPAGLLRPPRVGEAARRDTTGDRAPGGQPGEGPGRVAAGRVGPRRLRDGASGTWSVSWRRRPSPTSAAPPWRTWTPGSPPWDTTRSATASPSGGRRS